MTSEPALSPEAAEPVGSDVSFGGQSAFTVDVEEWYQVGAFENTLHRDDWPTLESRVEEQTHKILTLLAEQGVKATFFCLGWVAERHPLLINAIHSAGHEVACHGRDHRRLFTMTRDEFAQDLMVSKAQLEDATGARVAGYRAPSFSLTADVWWVYECLQESGFSYSSSLYPVKHDHYGMPNASRVPFWPIGKGKILEVPMSVCHLMGRSWPASGGGYFRLLPYSIGSRLFEGSEQQTGMPGIFYMHPWEMDPDQPFVKNAPALSKFRHYTGQARMENKVRKLINGRKWARMCDIFAPVLKDMGRG